jgi:HEAT repeat protein
MRNRFARWGLCASAVIVGLIIAGRAPARGQEPLNYRSAEPRALVRALKAPANRDAAAEALIARRAEVLPALRQSIRSGDRDEKMLAASVIAEMRDRGSLDDVLAASADRDVLVRRRAATVLRVLADGRSRPRLREILQSEDDLGVIKTALAALGKIGQRRDIVTIAAFLNHGDEGVRVIAAGSLAMLGDQRALDVVLQATQSADPGNQKTATYLLGLFSDPAAGERIRAILADPNGAWKAYALIAQAQQLLARQSLSERVATLDGLAHSRSRTASEWAVDQLTDIGNPDAVAVLRKVQTRSTPVGKLAQRRLVVLGVQP